MPLTILLHGLDTSAAPRLPALEMLLSRADAYPAPQSGMPAVLAGQFGLTVESLAVAPLARLADTGQRDGGFWLRADPVQLAADRDQLVMLPLSTLDVQTSEAHALAETFNHMYGREGFRLEAPVPTRWYLHLPDGVVCTTFDPAFVVGGSVLEYMPAGSGARQLKQLMNEMQMLFHEHPVNLEREASGMPLINGAWLWGGGYLPNASGMCNPQEVVTDIPLVRGLALLADVQPQEWPASSDSLLTLSSGLLALQVSDVAVLERFEAEIAGPLWGAVRTGNIEIEIYPGGKHIYRITRGTLRRFWRRRRPLAELLDDA